MPNRLNQKGFIPPIALAVIVIVLIGGFFLISKNNSSKSSTKIIENENISPDVTPIPSPTPSPEWETYNDEKYGYSIKYPQGWTVENLSSKDSSSIRLSDDQKTAFVLIDSIIGPSLEKTGEKEKVIDLLEGKLKTNTHIKINAFVRSNENDLGGYLATGEETYDNKTVLFEERFIVAKNGRGLRMHSIYASDSAKINKPLTQEIMGSYKSIK